MVQGSVSGCLGEEVSQGSVLLQQLFPMYTSNLFSIVENKLYGHADDSTFVAVVPSHGEKVAAPESMNCDLNGVSVWCDMWGMKLNARHLLNKYQIEMGFSHFHGIWDKHICTISNRCCEVIWF